MRKKKKSFKPVINTSPYDLFITVTYREKPKGSPRFQLESTMVDLLKTLDSVGQFECYPEYTLKGEIHYHIMLVLSNKYSYYKMLVPFLNRQGYWDSQYIKNYPALFEYCNKERPITEKLLNCSLPLRNNDRQLRAKHWRSLIKKYKKEVRDLYTELYHVRGLLHYPPRLSQTNGAPSARDMPPKQEDLIDKK